MKRTFVEVATGFECAFDAQKWCVATHPTKLFDAVNAQQAEKKKRERYAKLMAKIMGK